MTRDELLASIVKGAEYIESIVKNHEQYSRALANDINSGESEGTK